MTITGLSKSTIYRLIITDDLPAPIKIGRSSRWDENQIREWIYLKTRLKKIS